jgi:hypothetical protein
MFPRARPATAVDNPALGVLGKAQRGTKCLAYSAYRSKVPPRWVHASHRLNLRLAISGSHAVAACWQKCSLARLHQGLRGEVPRFYLIRRTVVLGDADTGVMAT